MNNDLKELILSFYDRDITVDDLVEEFKDAQLAAEFMIQRGNIHMFHRIAKYYPQECFIAASVHNRPDLMEELYSEDMYGILDYTLYEAIFNNSQNSILFLLDAQPILLWSGLVNAVESENEDMTRLLMQFIDRRYQNSLLVEALRIAIRNESWPIVSIFAEHPLVDEDVRRRALATTIDEQAYKILGINYLW